MTRPTELVTQAAAEHSPAPAGAGWDIVLVEPEIPQNTGSVARLCAGTGCLLHLVEPLGFSLADRYLRRAGLDYWPSVALRVHSSLEHFQTAFAERQEQEPPPCLWLFCARAPRLYTEVSYRRGDHLVFGSESKGLPRSLL
ncbi:MAG: tRNA (cytidine(34)-2'-O)-methyltransferase, partial [Deltaproteobacteria bacterium]|nr:tRNA (cytidine(34)-2'-O)-methyltransferase [Deltaproteobacteria bacterium]